MSDMTPVEMLEQQVKLLQELVVLYKTKDTIKVIDVDISLISLVGLLAKLLIAGVIVGIMVFFVLSLVSSLRFFG